MTVPAEAPQRWFVPGQPTPFAGQERERVWKEAIAAHTPVPATDSHTGLTVRFVMTGAQDGGRGGDLDNLLDPVLSVVVNRLGYCGGRRPNLKWLAASKQFAEATGAEIDLGARRPAWSPESAREELLDGIYDGPLPKSATDSVFADWVRARISADLDDGRVAVRLQFAAQSVNLGEVATGKVKPLIDGLWPLLGGTPRSPEDWRIRVLLLEKGVQVAGEVSVSVYSLPVDPE